MLVSWPTLVKDQVLFYGLLQGKEWKKEGSSWFCSFCKCQVVTIWGTMSWTLSLTSSSLHRPPVFLCTFLPEGTHSGSTLQDSGSPQTRLLLQALVTKCKETWLTIKLYLPFDSKGENLCLFPRISNRVLKSALDFKFARERIQIIHLCFMSPRHSL